MVLDFSLVQYYMYLTLKNKFKIKYHNGDFVKNELKKLSKITKAEQNQDK